MPSRTTQNVQSILLSCQDKLNDVACMVEVLGFIIDEEDVLQSASARRGGYCIARRIAKELDDLGYVLNDAACTFD